MRLYKLFCGSSASGPLTMEELRRAISKLPIPSDFRVAVFGWAIPVGYGWYRYLGMMFPIIAQREIFAAVGLAEEINKSHLAERTTKRRFVRSVGSKKL